MAFPINLPDFCKIFFQFWHIEILRWLQHGAVAVPGWLKNREKYRGKIGDSWNFQWLHRLHPLELFHVGEVCQSTIWMFPFRHRSTPSHHPFYPFYILDSDFPFFEASIVTSIYGNPRMSNLGNSSFTVHGQQQVWVQSRFPHDGKLGGIFFPGKEDYVCAQIFSTTFQPTPSLFGKAPGHLPLVFWENLHRCPSLKNI